jgi:hypothetical protein
VGYVGSRGTDGTSVQILGSTSTYATLPGSYLGNIGDGYITSDNGHLNIWVGDDWLDVGNIVGPQGELGYTGSIGFTGSQGIDGYTGSQGDVGYVGSRGNVGYVGSQGEKGDVGSAGDLGYTGSIGFTGSAGVDGVIGRDGYTGSQGDIGYTGSAVEGLVSDGIGSITIQSGYTLVFPDGSGQLSAAPRMYTNADAANGLSLSDLKPGDYYYDDVNAAIFICYDTGLGYFDILDLTVRA